MNKRAHEDDDAMGGSKLPRVDSHDDADVDIDSEKVAAIAAAQTELLDPRLSDLASFLAATTLPFPSYLPTQYPYTEASFYVRECYATYYDYVVGSLGAAKELRGLTVTGTPGIGTSVFMAYVFVRYRLENPQATIIVESYGATSTLREVLVWQNGTIAEWIDRDTAAMEHALHKYSWCSSLDLMDGPPQVRPAHVKSYAVFTSPNDEWKSQVWKDHTHRTIFMPLWDLQELRDAAEALELERLLQPLDDGEIRLLGLKPREREVLVDCDVLGARFHVFGGVARGCLALEAWYVKRLRLVVEEAIRVFDNRTSYAGMRLPTRDERDRLCHFFLRDPSVFTECSMDVASPFIAQRLQERMSELSEAKQRDFELLLFSDVAAASSIGFVLTRRAHKMLGRGVRIEARLLSTVASPAAVLPTSFAVNETALVSAVAANFTLMTLPRGPYFVLKSKSVAGIDSFYCQKLLAAPARTRDDSNQPDVLLFLTTASMAHPVDAEGVVDLLTRLGLWDGVTTPSAALVFIVPTNHGSSFKRQPVQAIDDAARQILEQIPQYVWGI